MLGWGVRAEVHRMYGAEALFWRGVQLFKRTDALLFGGPMSERLVCPPTNSWWTFGFCRSAIPKGAINRFGLVSQGYFRQLRIMEGHTPVLEDEPFALESGSACAQGAPWDYSCSEVSPP